MQPLLLSMLQSIDYILRAALFFISLINTTAYSLIAIHYIHGSPGFAFMGNNIKLAILVMASRGRKIVQMQKSLKKMKILFTLSPQLKICWCLSTKLDKFSFSKGWCWFRKLWPNLDRNRRYRWEWQKMCGDGWWCHLSVLTTPRLWEWPELSVSKWKCKPFIISDTCKMSLARGKIPWHPGETHMDEKKAFEPRTVFLWATVHSGNG